MEELVINPPKGYEVDEENSTFKKIVFKKIALSYKDITNKLFSYNNYYCTSSIGEIIHVSNVKTCYLTDPNSATSEEQLRCILAKNKLANVARYLNGDWKPSDNEVGVAIDNYGEAFSINEYRITSPAGSSRIYFKNEPLAKQAIEILGKEEVKLALKPLY